MKKPLFFTLAVIACVCVALLSTQLFNNEKQSPDNTSSFSINFNQGWKFTKTAKDTLPLTDDGEQWQAISLPHTPNIEPKIVNEQWQGYSWYIKEFHSEKTWEEKIAFIRFEGAMNKAEVWLNNKKLAVHHGGYLPFVVNITQALNSDQKNTLIVKLNNHDNPVTGPKPLKSLDFLMYGGLYRGVTLSLKNKIHITDEIAAQQQASGGIFVTYPLVTKQQAQVSVKTHIQNASNTAQDISVSQQIILHDKVIAETHAEKFTLPAKQSKQTQSLLNVLEPALWSPQSPQLYQLVTTVYQNGTAIDQKHTNIGIRHFELRNNELFINGEKTFLRGVNRHQEYPYIGYALSDNAQWRDAIKIKEAGFDYVRLSHYPHSPAFMDAADNIGLVVLDAILGWQYFSEDKTFQEHVFQTCRDMIRRDRNHASVLAWECSLNESWMPETFIDTLHEIVHQEFPGDNVYSAGWQSYGYDIYLQARQHRLEHYKKPNKPYVVSEYGDWEYYAMNAGLNQDSWGELLQEERSSRQLLSDGEKRLLQQASNIQEAHNDNLSIPAFADGYWVMFDYNRGYANDLEASGIMSIDRIPKYAYYFYQSQRDADQQSRHYQSGPMVYIASDWDKSSSSTVRIFSNTQTVELFLNGVSLGIQQADNNAQSNKLSHPPFTFALKEFVAGELKALAYIDSKVVAEHTIHTPLDKVASITLEIDESRVSAEAGVNDVIFAYARLRDKNGTVLKRSGEPLEISLQGDVELINPSPLLVESGELALLLKIGDSLNGASVKVTSPSLKLESKTVFFSTEE
ncbi:MAG: DUF4982 domain-containing protein [Spongiibacteraceae bacterium]|nr:DUF4982 domain-containing protein [Spongiibacteraceae bacterium]